MCKMISPLVRFTRDAILVDGVIELPIVIGKVPTEVTVSLEFLVVHTRSAYNIILERLGLNALRAVISTYHMLVKFSTRARVRDIQGDLLMAQ